MQDQVMGPLLRVLHRLGRIGANAVPTALLNRGEFFCLGAICNAGEERPEQGGIYVWELARRTHVLPPAVSRTLRELERKNYIERSVDREDRRNVKVRPTEEGRRLWALAQEEALDFSSSVLERMGEENMEELVRLCDRLCDIIEEKQGKPKGDNIC